MGSHRSQEGNPHGLRVTDALARLHRIGDAKTNRS
jgi:hypothetical protein